MSSSSVAAAAAAADSVVSLAVPSPMATAILSAQQTSTPLIPSRRLVTLCWSHEETLALLDAYRDKWFALRRGNLRASDWQDVAADVASRSPSDPPKTPVQCRHKIEKLRKRFRTERQKSMLPADPSAYRRPISASSWAYFAKMEAMERGEEHVHHTPPPVVASAPPNNYPNLTHGSPFLAQYLLPRPQSSSDEDDEDNSDDNDDVVGVGKYYNTNSSNNNPSLFRDSRGVHNMMIPNGRRHAAAAAGMPMFNSMPPELNDPVRFGGVPETGRERIPSPNVGGGAFFRGGYGGEMKEEMEEMEEKRRRAVDKRERKRKERKETSAMGELASALRVLGDGFLRMEYRKMEMAREMEKMKMEMELKRTEMILDSQRRLVDAFVNGLFSRKKAKISPEERM